MRLLFTALTCLMSVGMFAQLSNESIDIEGLNRTYLLYLPSDFNMTEPLPLVLSFHGGTGSANDQLAIADMRDLADSENFILRILNQ